MPYLNQDDNFPDHPKIAGLSDAAYRLHHAALCYSAKYLLDGFLTTTQVRQRPGFRPGALRELLVDVWHDLGGGCGTKTCPVGREGHYLLHDYLQWNKSRDWWEDKRRKDAERLAKWRAEQAANDGGMP